MTTYCQHCDLELVKDDTLGWVTIADGVWTLCDESPTRQHVADSRPIYGENMTNLDIDPQEWLKQQFEFEYCAECGGDWYQHDAVPVMGNWFARCKLPPIDDDTDDGNFLIEFVIAVAVVFGGFSFMWLVFSFT